MDEFRETVLNNHFHIVAVTETWAREEVDDAELNIDSYTVYRKDRKSDINKKGEGVYVKDSLKYQTLQQQEYRLELRRNFFSHRVVPYWNKLPETCQRCDG